MAYAPIPDHLVRLTELDAVWREASAGGRFAAVRPAARALHDRLAAAGPAVSVRTADVATFPYPTRFGLDGAARSLAPFVMMRNRVQLVQVRVGGALCNIVVNPTDPDRSLAAPFFARQIEKYGDFLAKRVMSARHGTLADALAAWGLAPGDVDYITFDHLHVQDLRGLLGTLVPEPGRDAPTRAFLPNAKLLAQKSELATLEQPHPAQRYWYVDGGMLGIDPRKVVALDGDYALGTGFAMVRTPGHTIGNHSLVVVTDRGVWTISENGIAVDAYAPEASAIAGLRAWARSRGAEVVLNANTREHSLDQYTSMVLEKTLADPVADRPEFPQHFSSSELVRHPLAPGLAPTYSHGAITHGTVVNRKATVTATLATALVVAIALAAAACGGKSKPGGVGNSGGGGDDLSAHLMKEIGGGEPVAIVPGPKGLRAISADGKRERVLAPGYVRWALLDTWGDVVWFADADTHAVKLIDLEGPPAEHPAIVTVATDLPDETDAAAPMISIGYVSSSPPPPTVDIELGGPMIPKIQIVVGPDPGLDASGGILDMWGTGEAFRADVKKQGKIAARDLLVALYERSKRPSRYPSYDVEKAPERVDTIDKSNCEDEEQCGTAEQVMKTKLWRVAVTFTCGDGCYTDWQLYDPATKKFLDAEWAKWLDDAEEAPDGSAFVFNGRVVRFDSGPVAATPETEDGMIGGGWLGGGYHYGM